MEKQFKKTLASIQTRSNRSHSDTVREFFNCVSYTMIMNSLYQLEKREQFYSGETTYRFSTILNELHVAERNIIITNRHKFKVDSVFYKRFANEITYISGVLSNEIGKNPLTDIFNELFEDLFLTGKKGENLGQFLTPNRLSEAICRFVGWEKNIKYNIGDICAGTGSLLFPLLREIYSKEGFEGVQKIKLIYNDIDSLMAQLFMAQILTNMAYHNLDFKDLRVYIGDAITEYDTINTLFLRVKQNKLVAKRVLEIDREKKAA